MTRPALDTDPSLRFLPRRYRQRVQKMLNHAYDYGLTAGTRQGILEGKSEAGKAKIEFKTELAMTIQRLGDANAQIATQLGRIMEKL